MTPIQRWIRGQRGLVRLVALSTVALVLVLTACGNSSSSTTTIATSSARAASVPASSPASAPASVPASTPSVTASALASSPSTAPATAAASCATLIDDWYLGTPTSAGAISGGGKEIVAELHTEWAAIPNATSISLHYADAHGMLGFVLMEQYNTKEYSGNTPPTGGPPACNQVALNAWNQGLSDLKAATSIEQLQKTLHAYDPTALRDANAGWYQFAIVAAQG